MQPLSIRHGLSFRSLRPRAIAAVLGSAALMATLVSCGGSSSSGSDSTTVPQSVVQLSFGDAPAHWMLAFSMQVSSMEMNRTNGGSVSFINQEMTMEMTRLMAAVQPVALVSAPQATYTGATITISAVNATYFDPNTHVLVTQRIAGPFTATTAFASPVTLGDTPYLFNFDLDLLHSVTKDNAGNLAFSPVFHMAAAAQGSGGIHGPATGSTFLIAGVVSGVSANSFVLESPQAAQSLTFATDTNTVCGGNLQTRDMLHDGMGVQVRAGLQADGTLLATGIHSRMNSGGMMGGGIVTAVMGTPATELTVVMQNGAGASVNTDYFSKALTVTLTDNTSFEIDDDRVPLDGLAFSPVFDASHIYAGQSVLPISESTGMKASGMAGNAGSMTASAVRLEEQGFLGTGTTDGDVPITPGDASTFTLNLSSDSAFTHLTGASEITVYQLTSTRLYEDTAIDSGATLRVHGLLFWDADSAEWKLVASTIAAN